MLDAAMAVFWQHGFEATSLADLLAAMNLSKSSFYNAFGSKHALFECCLARFRSRQVGRMRHGLSSAPSPMAFVRGLLLSAAAEAREPTPPRGCLIMNTATELSGRDPSVAALVANAAQDFAGMFRLAVEQAQEQGEIPRERDPAVLAGYLLTVMAGIRTMVKAGRDADEIEQIAEVAIRALH
ncbi:TetR/AcrR family transcriptional regulator [Rhodocyclaceae bacterium SMB388]